MLAADHVILDDALFLDAVRSGLEAAGDGKIVVFGLPSTAPKTNFGYIRPGVSAGENEDVRLVEAFFEKPKLEDALAYLREGYLWNSGNFLFRSDRMIEEFDKYAPEVLAAARRSIAAAQSAGGIMRLDETAFLILSKNIDRLCGDAKVPKRRCCSWALPLVRHRQLGCDLGDAAA